MGRQDRTLIFSDVMQDLIAIKEEDRDRITNLRIENGLKVLQYCDDLEKEMGDDFIIDIICKEKMAYAATISTDQDAKELWRQSQAIKKGKRLVLVGKFHSDAEEYMALSAANDCNKLDVAGQARYTELFMRYFIKGNR